MTETNPNDEWISVFKALPLLGEEVLVWHDYGDWCGTQGVCIDTWAPHPMTGKPSWSSTWGGAVTMGSHTHWRKMIEGPRS